jgi:WD40 repeat protein
VRHMKRNRRMTARARHEPMAAACRDEFTRAWYQTRFVCCDGCGSGMLMRIRNHMQREAHTGEVNSITYDPSGERIASGSADTTIKIWRSSGELQSTLSGKHAQLTPHQPASTQYLIVLLSCGPRCDLAQAPSLPSHKLSSLPLETWCWPLRLIPSRDYGMPPPRRSSIR